MKIIKQKGKRGAPRIIYTKAEQDFYKKHKRKIINGLSDDVAKNSIKKVFFSSVKEEVNVNHITPRAAMDKVLRSRTFTTEEENFKLYKETVLSKTLKGQIKTIKRHLNISQKQKFDFNLFQNTSEGWVYSNDNRTVLLKRRPDTKTEGYEVIYE